MNQLGKNASWPFPESPADERIAQLERRLERERRARQEAERLAENGLRDLYVSRARIELLNGISVRANESDDPLEVLRLAVREICTTLGFPFGNVLVADPDAPGAIRAAGISFARTCDSAQPFIKASHEVKIAAPADDRAEQPVMTQVPVWTPDIDTLDGFERARLARLASFKSMLTVPVLSGRDVEAVLEFFSMDQREPELELLDVLLQAGLQIGGVFRRRHHADRLRDSALTDPLTGLPNRAAFAQNIERSFRDCRAANEPAPSLIFIDLDGFKLVNDTLGHQAGDRLLIDMADKLRMLVSNANAFEDENPFASNVKLARLAGDEFTLIVDGLDRAKLAERFAAEIHLSLRHPQWLEDNPVRVTASIGVAHDDGHYTTVSDMLRDADLAMYEAKSLGSERTVVFDQKMRNNVQSRLTLVNDLRTACENGDFILHYQPILALDTEQLVGFEALVRWKRGDVIVPPSEFIAAAEESGVITLLGQWVMREACKTAVRWHKLVPDREPPLRISLNVAPRQFLQPTFVQQVREILNETGADPRWIGIEITEGAAITKPHHTARVLEELRALNIQVGLDDFGTGYSSLSRLQTIPIDNIKIDQSFVRTQTRNNAQWSVVKAMLDLAHALQLRVVVEGLETEFQREELTAFGCEYGQGYLFSKPLTEEDAAALIIDQPEGPFRQMEKRIAG
jgi:diguanylate cyclase (GGDEF)-like protein